MKLPLLLTQYLYNSKKLNLPGIGTFTLDPAAVLPDESNKDLHPTALGISFKNASIQQADDDLIDFIKSNTGKIRPLAIADLESYLTLGTQLLNIGKPFYLEGIGTITKAKQGGFEFTPGEYSVVSKQDSQTEKRERSPRRKTGLEESQFSAEPNTARNIVIFTAIMLGLSLIGWGGYLLYKKNTHFAGHEQIAIQPDSIQPIKDTQAHIVPAQPLADSVISKKSDTTLVAASATGDSVVYKFNILQTHDKERALKRFNQLLGYDLKVKLFSQDSSFFKVFFIFPALPRDTVHIKDSLRREYAHEVIIEK